MSNMIHAGGSVLAILLFKPPDDMSRSAATTGDSDSSDESESDSEESKEESKEARKAKRSEAKQAAKVSDNR